MEFLTIDHTLEDVRVDDVMEYISGDFGCSMKYSLDAQVANWEAYMCGEIPPSQMHEAEIAYGGPIAYVEYLAGVMREVGGWIGPPLRVDFYEDDRYVKDGHHRFAAAVYSNQDIIPATIVW